MSNVNVVSDYFRFKEQRIIKKPQSSISSSNVPVNCADRPKMSYTQLIVLALESSPKKALTVNEIYNWIEQNYPFYEGTGNGWKNSLRHNLSINKCFRKVIKTGQMGRGSYWIIEPARRAELMDTVFKSHLVTPGLPQLMLPSPQIVYIKDTFSLPTAAPPVVVPTPAAVKPKHERLPRKSNIHIIGSKPPRNPATSTQKLEWDLEVDGAPEIVWEKPQTEWTDTRLEESRQNEEVNIEFDSDILSVTSDTDHNDTWRCVSRWRAPIFPPKYHTVSLDEVKSTPVVSPDHTYCFSHRQTSGIRHVFCDEDNEVLDHDLEQQHGYNECGDGWCVESLCDRRQRLLLASMRHSPTKSLHSQLHLHHTQISSVARDVKKRGRPKKVQTSHEQGFTSCSRPRTKRRPRQNCNKENGRYMNDPIPLPSMTMTDLSDESYSNQMSSNQIEDDDALSQPIARSHHHHHTSTDKLENMYNFSAFVDSL